MTRQYANQTARGEKIRSAYGPMMSPEQHVGARTSPQRPQEASSKTTRTYRQSISPAARPGAVSVTGPRRAPSLRTQDDGMSSLPLPRSGPSRAAAAAAAHPPNEPALNFEEAQFINGFHGQSRNAYSGNGRDRARAERSNRQSRYSSTSPAQFATPERVTAFEEVPIAAEIVENDGGDLEAQVNDRVRNERDEIAAQVQKRMMEQAVRADVVRDHESVVPVNENHDSGTENHDSGTNSGSRRCMIILGIVVLLAVAAGAAVGVVLAVGKKDESKSSPTELPATLPPNQPPTPPPTQPQSTTSPTPPPAAEKRMIYQADWTGVFKNSNGQALCEQPTTGVIASCGNGGKIELLDTSNIARCNKRNSNDIFCSTVRPPTQDDDFLAVVYSCTGTSTSAWTTRVDDVPDGTVECTAGGVTGTRIWIGQGCANSSKRNYNLIQCDPPQAQQELGEGSDAFRTCLTTNTCTSGNCTLSTLDVAAFIPESEISESCLSDPQ